MKIAKVIMISALALIVAGAAVFALFFGKNKTLSQRRKAMTSCFSIIGTGICRGKKRSFGECPCEAFILPI